MMKTLKRAAWPLALLIVGLVFIVQGITPHLEPNITMPDDAPVTSTMPTTTVAPPAPSPTVTTTTATPTPTATPSMADPQGNPKQIVIRAAGTNTLLVSTALVGVTVPQATRWSPQNGRAEWLADFPRPGTLARFHGIVAGHVSGGGKPGVFYGLTKVQVGDTVKITYDSGDVVMFTVATVTDVGKTDVTTDPSYDWVWNVAANEPANRLVSIFTCDPTAPHVNGHSVSNIVVQATRTS